MGKERGERTSLNREAVKSRATEGCEDELLDFETPARIGEGAADRVASLGGNYVFILSFLAILIGWVDLNAAGLLARPFAPYPFILLNLPPPCEVRCSR